MGNYVPLVFHGWMDCDTLKGEGYFTYDEARAATMKEEDKEKKAKWDEFQQKHEAWKARTAQQVLDVKLDQFHGQEHKKYLVKWNEYDEEHNTWVWDFKVDDRPDLAPMLAKFEKEKAAEEAAKEQ